jgi:outer membrane protein assembly factor BamB
MGGILFMNNSSLNIIMIFGLISMLIISTVTSMGIGNKIEILDNKPNVDIYNMIDYNGSVFSTSNQLTKKYISNQELKIDSIIPKIMIFEDSIDSPWPMYCQNPRHTGRSPYSTADTEGIEKWRFDTDECSGSPVIDKEGIIYVSSNHMHAIYPNGTMKWRYPTGTIVTAAALDEKGILYFGTLWRDKLFALYSSNGTVKWKYKLGDTWASPTVGNDGIIYAPATDNYKVHAVYPNGTRKWVFKAAQRVYSSPAIGEDGTIYCTSYNGNLYALYPENGTELWKYKVPGHIRTSPCIADDGTIYTVSTDGPLFAFNSDGTVKWNTTSVGGGTSPTIGQDGTIYCGYRDLYAVNPVNGSIKWRCDLGRDRTIKEGTPCNSVDGTIYLGTYIGENKGGELIAVNPDGTEKWRKMIAYNWVMSAPAIGSDGTVYVGSWNDGTEPWAWGYLHAFGTLDPDAPSAPEIDGPSSGNHKVEYSFNFSSISPLGNDVYYWIEWGDGLIQPWSGPYKSGEEIAKSHSWYYEGNYTIKARAKDSENLWGPWSEHEISIPRTRASSYQWLLERFPLLERLLGWVR